MSSRPLHNTNRVNPRRRNAHASRRTSSHGDLPSSSTGRPHRPIFHELPVPVDFAVLDFLDTMREVSSSSTASDSEDSFAIRTDNEAEDIIEMGSGDVNRSQLTQEIAMIKQKSTKRPRTHSGSDNESAEIPSRSNLANNLNDFRKSKQFTDVVLDVEGKEIPCHKCVLAATSAYFFALWKSDMKEKHSGRVEILNHNYDVMQQLVQYAYTEKLSINATNAQSIIEAADYFQMNELKKRCEKFLIAHISHTNCLGFIRFAKLHNLDSLNKSALCFAVKNFNTVCQQEEFMSLSSEELLTYLSNDNLSAKCEENVFNALLSWIQHDDSRLEDVAKVLKCVRLSYVNPFFLFETIGKHKLLQNVDCVQKMMLDACKFKLLGTKTDCEKPRNTSGISEVMVVIGGICNNNRLFYTDYYRQGKGWSSFANIDTDHRHMHSYSVCTLHNDIIVTGGHTNAATTTSVSTLFLSHLNKWVKLPNMLTTRERHGSASIGGYVYVVGGLCATSCRKKPFVLSDVERFCPALNHSWEAVKPLPLQCYSPGVVSFRGKLYVIGGVSMRCGNSSNSSKVVLDGVQCYDPIANTWETQPLGKALARLSCAVYKDHIYMISNNHKSIFSYDPIKCVLDEWKQLPYHDLEFAGLATYKNMLVISGGQQGSETRDTMSMYNFETKELVATINMARPLCMHGCVTIDKYG